MNTTRTAAVVLGAALLVMAVSAGGPSFWRAYFGALAAAPVRNTLLLHGGDGASLPVATPEDQGLDAQALQSAAMTAGRVGARALLVARHGHLLFAQTLRGASDAAVRSTLLSQLVLATGVAAILEQGPSPELQALDAVLHWSLLEQGRGSARNPWSTRSSARYGAAPVPPLPAGQTAQTLVPALSAALWQPLAAVDAHYEVDGAGRARLLNGLWLRPRDALALLSALQSGGQVGGQRLLSAQLAAHVLAGLDDGSAPRGAEAFGARPARVLRDDEGTRAYFFPAQELVILLIGADETLLADETGLAHQVLRGIVDTRAPAAAAPAIGDLVPLH